MDGSKYHKPQYETLTDYDKNYEGKQSQNYQIVPWVRDIKKCVIMWFNDLKKEWKIGFKLKFLSIVG